MLLRSLHVENLLGVERATLDFDETTVLIGENDAGRTSLLEGLALVLEERHGDPAFTIERPHFHQPPGWKPGLPLKPIRLVVGFEERFEGEWCGEAYAPFAGAQASPPSTTRRLWLDVTIREIEPGGAPETRWGFRTVADGPCVMEGARAPLDALRRLSPLIWLRAGVMEPFARRATPGKKVGPARTNQALAEEVERQYQRILEGTTNDPQRTLELGYRAAQTLLNRIPKSFRKDRTTLGSVLQEISGRADQPVGQGRQQHAPGTAAHRLGIFLLAGAMVRAYRASDQAGSIPILVVEDPEAHLHPMTVASVWGVLEEINLQKIIATHSGSLLASAPLGSLRRLVRRGGEIEQYRVPVGGMSRDEMRRLTYHLRSRRSVATFARCLLLVEGETEFWFLPELARICGYDFAAEGVTCVEFAQCGLMPLVRFARYMGIGWHLLTDGDEAGNIYRGKAERLLSGDGAAIHITQLSRPGYRTLLLATRLRRRVYPRGIRSGQAGHDGPGANHDPEGDRQAIQASDGGSGSGSGFDEGFEWSTRAVAARD